MSTLIHAESCFGVCRRRTGGACFSVSILLHACIVIYLSKRLDKYTNKKGVFYERNEEDINSF